MIRSAAQIRQRLLDACTDYALAHGLPDRLGPLATAAGTSNRMLIYHFGTRDGLLREVLGQARQRQVKVFTEWPGFRRTATTDWLAPLKEGMRSVGRPELATVVLAVIRGLLMDLDATGNTTRTHRAFADFLTMIDSA